LAAVGQVVAPSAGLATIGYDPKRPSALRAAITAADVVICQPQSPLIAGWIAASGARHVTDLYDPEIFENLELFRHSPDRLSRLWITLTTDRLAAALRTAHHVICASDRQRDLWLGAMVGQRAIPRERYCADPAMAGTALVVPFGVPSQPPTPDPASGVRARFPAIGPSDEIVLWNGGIWSWLDPETAVRAVGLLAERRPSVRFVTMGASDHRNGKAAAEAMRSLASQLGLLGRVVLMNDAWVPYADRGAWLLEADCALSCHLDHLETRFAFRTRLLDCFWAGLPVVCTEGDVLADRVRSEHLGEVVTAGDPAKLASALERVLDAKKPAYADGLAAASVDYQWTRVVEPLRRVVALGRPDPGERISRRGPRAGERARSFAQTVVRRVSSLRGSG
jgi:glycosyltransferase involved in cell wall biosynthesis